MILWYSYDIGYINSKIWAVKWLVKFNAKKTQLMTISRKSNRDAGKISFLGETLKEEDSIKLLGVHITKTLDWNFHVNKIAKRAGQHLGIVRKANKLLPSDVLATLYKTRVRSVMEYCGPIWENASKTVLSKLDTIQRKACRVIGHDNDVCSKVNITSLEHRRRVSGLSQLHRMISGTAPDGVVQLLPSFQEPSRVSRHVLQNHHLQLVIKRSKTEHHRKSFLPRICNLWNSLPKSCIYGSTGDTIALQPFKVCINKWMLSSTN